MRPEAPLQDRVRQVLAGLDPEAELVDADVEAAWVLALQRVQDDLGEGVAPRAAPKAAAFCEDRSAWVWRPPEPLGPTGGGVLTGARLGVKDLISVCGRPLRAGSWARREVAAEPEDAPVVAALRAAGASLVGTTKLHEFAFGVTGLNACDGTPENPAAPGRVPGGSSSGSAAAVAAGEADVALGTDTGGSCRIPAALCGVVGYKPSFGRVDVSGVFPLAPSLDHVGWLTLDVATARTVAEVLGVVRPGGSTFFGAAGRRAPAGEQRRLGVHRRAVEEADPDVRSAVDHAIAVLEATGWELHDVPWPTAQDSFAASTAIMFAEAAHVHRASLPVALAAYGDDVRARLLQGSAIDLGTYLRAAERRHSLRQRCWDVLGQVTAVLSPTAAVVPPRRKEAEDPSVAARLVANTRLANLTGLPALSVPAPEVDLPVGVQIEAADDETAFAVAAAVEAALRREI